MNEKKNMVQEKMCPGNVGMKKLIPTMNKILDVCTQLGVNMQFDFPQIAVIGSQSAGKSSVLENFVGRDFLPRGCDIVTRCPIILQLRNAETEYGVFMHCQKKIFTDFNEIRKEIECETKRLAGEGVSAVPINLHIHSPNVLDLTLIDLPGITRDHIEEKIIKMNLEYIEKKNCLILAVSPANSDLALSDALKLANKVDPQVNRTIGVMTKLDLMDKGVDARDILENKKRPLRRGYVGIVNRSQSDIIAKKDISDALKFEREFFKDHKSYRHIADRMGTEYLQRTLNQQLETHIREKLPSLQDELTKKNVLLGREVDEFNMLHKNDIDTKKSVMTGIILKVQSDFEKQIGGFDSEDLRIDGLSNGAIICRLFHDRLSSEISKITLDFDQMHHDIHFAILGISGYRPVLFEPHMAFEGLLKKQIARLEDPVNKCIDSVVEELISAVRNSTKHVSNYPNLRGDIENNIISFIHNNGPKYRKSILSLIEMEIAYINTKHEEFMNNIPIQNYANDENKNADPNDVFSDEQSEENFKRELEEEVNWLTTNSNDDEMEKVDPTLQRTVESMYKNIDSYMRIVKKTMRDMVPKAITLYVIKELKDHIKKNLLLTFLGLPNDEYLKIFALTPEENEKHKEKLKIYEACKSALETIRAVSKEAFNDVVANEAIENGK